MPASRKRKREAAVETANNTGSKDTKSKKDSKADPPVYSHWLVKSEPESRFEKGVDMKFSFDDLKSEPDQTACWDGVRNYLARNYLRDQIKVDHDVFFYHSNTKEPGIVGICKVVKEGYPDHTQFDPKDAHYDSTSKKDQPKWYMVDVKYIRKLKRYVLLSELKKLHQEHKASGGPLANVALFTKARLSVQPLTKEEWDYIVKLEDQTP